MHCLVVGKDARLTREGDLQAILNEIEVRDIATVVFSNVEPDERFRPRTIVQILLTREGHATKPVQLFVRGDDVQWVAWVFDALSSRLNRCVPIWSTLRNKWSARIAGGAVGVSIEGYIFSQSDHVVSRMWLVGLLIMLTLGGLTGEALLLPLLVRAFPAFEVLELGGTPRLRRTLAAAYAVINIGLTFVGVALALKSS